MIEPHPDAEQVLELGPEDDGRPMTHDQFLRADPQDGYRYELVGGRLAVTPAPNLPHWRIQIYLQELLTEYRRANPDRIAALGSDARVLLRAMGGPCDVEPDLAVFSTLPEDSNATWAEMAPFLVVEVLSQGTRRKDLVRNRELYWRVASIEEYWIVDPHPDPYQPSLIALRRGPDSWLETGAGPGEVYRTDLLPGLVVDLAQVFRR